MLAHLNIIYRWLQELSQGARAESANPIPNSPPPSWKSILSPPPPPHSSGHPIFSAFRSLTAGLVTHGTNPLPLFSLSSSPPSEPSVCVGQDELGDRGKHSRMNMDTCGEEEEAGCLAGVITLPKL